MKFGIWIDNQNVFNTSDLVEYGILVEESGWDGIFVSDSPSWDEGYIDPFVLLGAIAARTMQIKLGTWILPLPLHRPWEVALQAAPWTGSLMVE